MNNIKSYDYNRKAEALLGHTKDGMYMIMRRVDPRWKELGGADDSFARAIYIGQGCWDELEDISKEDAERLLDEWDTQKKCRSTLTL